MTDGKDAARSDTPDDLHRARTELEAELARYVDLYDLSPVGYLTLNGQGVILESNLTAATLLGTAREALAGQPLARFVHPEDQHGDNLRHVQLPGQQGTQEWDMRLVRADNSSFYAHVLAKRAQGGECRIALSDVTERRKIEDAQNFLLHSGFSRPEEDFFNALARFLADSLGMDFVCIDRLHGDELSARTVAVYVDGKFEDNVEYALKDTPCGEVVGKVVCRFDAGVRHLFPRDAVLQDLAAESYVGTTLWSFDGRPIGLIAIIGRRPLANPRLAETILKLVSVRAAGELEREEAREKIQSLARFPAENPNPVLRLDRSGVVLYANEAGGVLLRDWGCSVGTAAPEDWRATVAEVYASRAPRTIEATFGSQQWSVFVAPVDGAGYVNLYATNTTERKRTEQALRESEERYRVIAESAREQIYFLDRDGRLRWRNAAALEQFGAIGMLEDLHGRLHPDDRSRFDARLQSMWGEDVRVDTVSYRLRMADGGYQTLESSFRKIFLSGEELLCVISMNTSELTRLRRIVSPELAIPGLVGRDPAMLELCSSVRELAEADVPVLIQGESGTGKELVAAAIHNLGPRAARHFVAINCGAIPENLLETELFGHVKGSFTGAIRDKKGRFELADGGTIFLDEVGDLSPAMQVKLLRVLQEGTFEKVGAVEPTRVDVRLISATNRDLGNEVKAGHFREDLYYRLSVVPLAIPPLRERQSDIPLLAEHILGEEARRADRRHDPSRPPLRVTLARETLALLLTHSWPGNVRELQNVLRFAMIKCKGGPIRPEHLPPSLAVRPPGRAAGGRKPKLTAEAAAHALERAAGRAGEAARNLGVSRATLYRYLAKQK